VTTHRGIGAGTSQRVMNTKMPRARKRPQLDYSGSCWFPAHPQRGPMSSSSAFPRIETYSVLRPNGGAKIACDRNCRGGPESGHVGIYSNARNRLVTWVKCFAVDLESFRQAHSSSTNFSDRACHSVWFANSLCSQRVFIWSKILLIALRQEGFYRFALLCRVIQTLQGSCSDWRIDGRVSSKQLSNFTLFAGIP
jgi:hypothetical protein